MDRRAFRHSHRAKCRSNQQAHRDNEIQRQEYQKERQNTQLRTQNFPLLDRRGSRERLFLIASGGVVGKLMLAQRSFCFGA
jgi:hypothetical protein